MKIKSIKNFLLLTSFVLIYPIVSIAVDKPKMKGMVSSIYSGSFSNPNGRVEITLTKMPFFSVYFITKFTVTIGSAKKTCLVTQRPYTKLNTGVSINFATFSWDGGNVQGLIGSPDTPYRSNISWKSISTSNCKVPDKSGVLLKE